MEWLTHYKQTGVNSYFLTFTYAPEHLPENGSLEKDYFLKWINNATRDCDPFRYYAIGEYGEESGRAHYHMAIFPKNAAQIDAIRAYWKKGFTQAAEMEHERARYLANYTTKKLTKRTDHRLAPGQEPEFRTSSRNPPLGAVFAENLITHWRQPRNAAHIEQRGDIERTFRFENRIYPLGSWVLNHIRKNLGIPLLHRDRIAANENYLDYHHTQEAEWNPYEAESLDKKLNAKKKQTHYRGSSQKI